MKLYRYVGMRLSRKFWEVGRDLAKFEKSGSLLVPGWRPIVPGAPQIPRNKFNALCGMQRTL